MTESPPNIPEAKDFFSRMHRSRVFAQLDRTHFFLGILIVVLNLLLFDTGRFSRLENFFFDAFCRHRLTGQADRSILLIKVDDDTLRSVGKWPWPWEYHAQMVDYLKDAGAKAVVFHWNFDPASATAEDQERFISSVKKAGNVYLPVTLEKKPEKKIWVHSMPIVLEPSTDQTTWTELPPAMVEAAKGIGHLVFNPDSDGILRRFQIRISQNTSDFLMLALKVVLDEKPKFKPRFHLDEEGATMLSGGGSWHKFFRTISYADLLRSFQARAKGEEPVLNTNIVKNKICMIGITSGDFAQREHLAFGPDVPIVAIHAYVLNQFLKEEYMRPLSTRQNIFLISLLGLAVCSVFASFRTAYALAAGALLGVLWFVAAFLLFSYGRVWIAVFHPLLLILSQFGFTALYHQVLAAKEKKKLYDLATRDGLTGLYVIRHFREILNQIVAVAQQYKEPLSLVLLDIDNFKKVNDTYGHPAGDMVLKKTAHVVMSSLRSKRPIHEIDFVARYGGEEIVILLRRTTLRNAAVKVADRIRGELEKTEFVWNGKKIPITASFGVSSLQEGELLPDPMVHRADEALYQAKRSGKNRVCTQTISIS